MKLSYLIDSPVFDYLNSNLGSGDTGAVEALSGDAGAVEGLSYRAHHTKRD